MKTPFFVVFLYYFLSNLELKNNTKIMLQIIFKINYSGQPKPKKNVRISLLRQVISLLPSSLVDWFGRKVIPPTGDFTL